MSKDKDNLVDVSRIKSMSIDISTGSSGSKEQEYFCSSPNIAFSFKPKTPELLFLKTLPQLPPPSQQQQQQHTGLSSNFSSFSSFSSFDSSPNSSCRSTPLQFQMDLEKSINDTEVDET